MEVNPLLEFVSRVMPECTQVESLMRLSGGASKETWSFDGLSKPRKIPLILRRSVDDAPPSGLDVARISIGLEAAVVGSCRAAGILAPEVIATLEPSDGLGQGYLMHRMRGETIARKILRDPDLADARRLLTGQCARQLAAIHAVKMSPSIETVLPRMDGPRQLVAYRAMFDSFGEANPIFEFAFKWLEVRMRPAACSVLVHGDYRLGNFLISDCGLEAVLDWEAAHMGDPVEDLAYICTNSWRFGETHNVVGGFGRLEAFLAAYEQSGGQKVSLDDVRSWIAFSSLKWGVQCMGMYREATIDNLLERVAIGRRVSEVQIDLINLIVHDLI